MLPIAPLRRWRFKLALKCLANRSRMRGSRSQIIAGCFTWAVLLNRISLSVFDVCNQFNTKCGNQVAFIPASVRAKLLTAANLVPLLLRRPSIPWSSTVFACDAILAGTGVVKRDLPLEEVSKAGREAEVWRFGLENALNARHHALSILLYPRPLRTTLQAAKCCVVCKGWPRNPTPPLHRPNQPFRFRCQHPLAQQLLETPMLFTHLSVVLRQLLPRCRPLMSEVDWTPCVCCLLEKHK